MNNLATCSWCSRALSRDRHRPRRRAANRAPRETWDTTLAESAPRSKYTITVVGVKRPGEDFTYAQPDTHVHRRDEPLVSSATAAVERFCALSSPAHP